MTYRAQWVLSDGTTPAPGPDLGQVQPGQTKTVTRLLKNIGDQPLSAVQVTLVDALDGVGLSVGGQPLIPGTPHTAPGLAPGESLEFVASRTVPPGAEPGPFAAFIRIRALT